MYASVLYRPPKYISNKERSAPLVVQYKYRIFPCDVCNYAATSPCIFSIFLVLLR